LKGVQRVVSGYANGRTPNPSYEAVCTGDTGHAEAVALDFDPAQLGLSDLLTVFFATHDPTTLNAQGHDHGTQYRSGVYYTQPDQAEVARALIAELTTQQVFAKPIVTEVLPLSAFWPAEAYHQNFFVRNPAQGYCLAVAAPKVVKLRRQFAHMLRVDA
jgi:peptide-methionine (S)-S-oxide reductase